MLNCKVTVGGNEIGNMLEGRVHVLEALNQHAWCWVEFSRSSDDLFAIEDTLGQDITIESVTWDGSDVPAFSGFVLECEAQNTLNNQYGYRIIGVSKSYKLDVAAGEKYFRKKTLKEVAGELCGPCGLSADVKASGAAKRNFVQWGETPFAFLKRIADFNQAWVLPTADGLQIADKFEVEQEVAWTGEGGLQTFRMAARLGPPSIIGVHYDPKEMKSKLFDPVKGDVSTSTDMAGLVGKQRSASESALPPAYESFDARSPQASDYQEMLKREAARLLGGRLSASGVSKTEGIRAGQKLSVKGGVMGAGHYGVVQVSHRWDLKDYSNEFICTPWAQWVEAAPPRPSLIPGVVSARVKANNDARKMGRLKIQYDWQEDGETSWIRMATPHAGADRGMLFLPEVGDEVLVAFEQGDPERPYIIGSLWNKVDQAPRDDFWGGEFDPNDVKRIVTKSGHRIQIVDKPGKEAIVIATPKKLKIGLYENANETNRPMLAVHSEGDLVLSAPNGRIHLHSKYFSREIGDGGGGGNQGGSQPPPAARAPAAPVSPPPAKSPAAPSGKKAASQQSRVGQPAPTRGPLAGAGPLAPRGPSPPDGPLTGTLIAATKAALAPTFLLPSLAFATEAWEKGKAGESKADGPELDAEDEKGILDDKAEPAASITWADKTGAAKQWGNDSAKLQALAYSLSASSGITKEDGGYSANLIQGEASISALHGEEEKSIAGGLVKQTGSVDVGRLAAYANIGATNTETSKEVKAEAGAEGDLATAKVGGEIDIPVPFTQKVLSLAGGVEGSVGVAAKASAEAGWNAKDGWVAGAEAKAAAGLGLGAWFKLGLKDKENG